MLPQLYAHPFSSYCQKVLIALYENEIAFEFRMLAPGDEQAAAEHEALWPLKRMPVLVDEGRTVVEASVIIEHLGLFHPGPVPLIPDNRRTALEIRMMDRIFDGSENPGALKLVDHFVSNSGVVITTYEPAGDVPTGTFETKEPSEAELERREKIEEGSW